MEPGPGPLAPGNVEHGLIKIQDTGGEVASEMGQQWLQPLGMARSSKYISMRRVPLCVSTIGVLFLDAQSSHQPDVQYWKYSGTGCSLITELKVWSCESWTWRTMTRRGIGGNQSCRQGIPRCGQLPLAHHCQAVPLSSVPHPTSCASASHGPLHGDGQGGLAIMMQIKLEKDVQ